MPVTQKRLSLMSDDNREMTAPPPPPPTTTATATARLPVSSCIYTASTAPLSRTFLPNNNPGQSRQHQDSFAVKPIISQTQVQSGVAFTLPTFHSCSWPNLSSSSFVNALWSSEGPEALSDSPFTTGRWLSSTNDSTEVGASSQGGDASSRNLLNVRLTDNDGDSPALPCPSHGTLSLLSNMPSPDLGFPQPGGSESGRAAEMTCEHDISETNNGGLVAVSVLNSVLQLNAVRRANTRLKKYQARAERLRQRTESKRKMLGALCVRRSLLLSEVVSAMQMVRASRQRLDNQRTANKALMKHIDHLTSLDTRDNDNIGSCGNSSGSISNSNSATADSANSSAGDRAENSRSDNTNYGSSSNYSSSNNNNNSNRSSSSSSSDNSSSICSLSSSSLSTDRLVTTMSVTN